jgi:putative ABC transport system permease protein
VRRLEPAAAIGELTSLSEIAAASIVDPRTKALTVVLFAATALALTFMGLYVVLAFATRQRRRELAIRLVFGATPSALRALLWKSAILAQPAAIGAGVCLAWAVNRGLHQFLPVQESDATIIYLGSSLFIGLVSATVTWRVAGRAAAADPIVSLRE